MRYSKQIVFFLFINFIVVFLSIFTGNLTRNLEVSNNQIQQNIESEKEQLQINQIEFSFYNNLNYLEKLHNIYFSFTEDHPEKKIVSLSDIVDDNQKRVILVKIK